MTKSFVISMYYRLDNHLIHDKNVIQDIVGVGCCDVQHVVCVVGFNDYRGAGHLVQWDRLFS